MNGKVEKLILNLVLVVNNTIGKWGTKKMNDKDLKRLENWNERQEKKINRIMKLAVPKERKIRVFKDRKMLISEWGFFIAQSGVLLTSTFWLLDFIKQSTNEQFRLLGLMIITFWMFRTYGFMRPPIEYRTEEVLDDLNSN